MSLAQLVSDTGQTFSPQAFSNFFQTHFGPFKPNASIAVGVSGGADSLALCLALKAWADRHQGRIIALTVDHGLRPESAEEARQVGQWLRTHHIEHHILTLPETLSQIPGNLQANARDARYRIMDEWCAENNIQHLAVAHQALDQAETYVLRKNRGSHDHGLSCMSEVRALPHTSLIRPFLAIWPQMLKDWLSQQKQSWIEDPSNRNTDFDRIKVRQNLSREEAEAILTTVQELGHKRRRHEMITAKHLETHATLYPAGHLTLDKHFLQTEKDILFLALNQIIATIGHTSSPVRGEEVRHLLSHMHDSSFKGHTVGGAYIVKQKDGFAVVRETGLAQPAVIKGQKQMLYDNRFLIKFKSNMWDNHVVQYVTEKGWPQIKEKFRLEGAQKHIVCAFPALVYLDEIVCVPHLNRNDTLTLDFKPKNALIKPFFQPVDQKKDHCLE